MQEANSTGAEHYRQRLEAFLRERHPRLVHAAGLLDSRSRAAAAAYREAIASGEDALRAATRADALLYEGLIFSKFDAIACLLALDYPVLPAERRRNLALEMEESLAGVFNRYNLDDGIYAREEYRRLLAELSEAVRRCLDGVRLPVLRKGRPPHHERL